MLRWLQATAAVALCVTDIGRHSASAAAHARTHGLEPRQPYAAAVCSIMVSTPTIRVIHGLLLIYRPKRDERLSWPNDNALGKLVS